MINFTGSSQSALRAYSTQINTNANNIANVNSDNYKSKDAIIQEGPNSQPKAVIRKDNSPGPLRQETSGYGKMRERELSNTDMTKQITGMINSKNAYNANLKAIKTSDQMTGSIINITG